MTQDTNKHGAATAALSYIKDGMSLGIGTGSTVDVFIEVLQPLAGKLGPIVSSSARSTKRLAELGMQAVELGSTGDLDLYVDGADEATKHRHLIKGGGGALTREKVLAAASRRFICIIDETKLVPTLGRFPLPVEVIPMERHRAGLGVLRHERLDDGGLAGRGGAPATTSTLRPGGSGCIH